MAGPAATPAAPPAPVKEDRPPWDDAPPPLDDYDRPPLPEEEPPMREPVAPPPRRRVPPAAPAATSNGPDPRWGDFIKAAEGKLPGYLASLLYQCSARFEEDSLTLQAPAFPFGQLNLPNNLAKMKQLTSEFFGRPTEFKLEQAQAGAPRPAARSLDDFKNDKFNDIVKFK